MSRVRAPFPALARPSPGELSPRLGEVLRKNADVGEHGHEARVACPARHEVLMRVVGDARAGDAADVPAEVVALRLVGGRKCGEPLRSEPMDLERLSLVEVAEADTVP